MHVCGPSIIYTVLYILRSFILGVHMFKSWEILVHYYFIYFHFFIYLFSFFLVLL